MKFKLAVNESEEIAMTNLKAKGEAIHETKILTSELGAIVGKTPQWIRQLTRDGVLKQVGRGKYILGDAVQAYIDHAAGGKEENGKPRYVDARTEHELIKKEKAEMELRALKGQLHEAKDVRMIMNDMIITAKSKLQAIPSRIAMQLENESATVIEETISREISEALKILSEYSPEKFKKKVED